MNTPRLKPALSNDWLSQAAHDTRLPAYSSQRGEDRILHKLFTVIGTTNRWCVEFGATDGKHLSNTWHLITHEGWHSVQIEGARDCHLSLRTRGRDSFDALVARYRNNANVVCLNLWVETSGPNTLDKILATTPLPPTFDLLAIDVDTTDYAIWESLHNYQPRVVIVEHNKTIPITINFNSDRGSSLLALTELGKRKGYELVAANDLNGVFVRRELFPKLGIRDNSPARLWPDHAIYRMRLEVDGQSRARLIGPNKLRWARGEDGTITGQLRSGQYTWLMSGETTIPSASPQRLRRYLSGWIRHWWYQLKQPR